MKVKFQVESNDGNSIILNVVREEVKKGEKPPLFLSGRVHLHGNNPEIADAMNSGDTYVADFTAAKEEKEEDKTAAKETATEKKSATAPATAKETPKQ